MKRLRILMVLFTIGHGAFALTSQAQQPFLPVDALNSQWVFSGVVSNDAGDRYGYYFQMSRHENLFHATAALTDAQGHDVLLFDESESKTHSFEPYYWQVGRAFLRFNPINDSWIFGLKTHHNQGFNFKIDMLTESGTLPKSRPLNARVEMLVSQTSHLNGHLQVGKDSQEQFVTAKNAWFEQTWSTDPTFDSSVVSGVFCRFDDGSGFYSIGLANALPHGETIAGWRDPMGIASPMSQFITVNQADDEQWHISITAPKHELLFTNVVKQGVLAAGFLSSSMPGFCTVR